MRILAIETASPIASVALIDAGGMLASRTLRAPMRHLEWVAAAIEGMLRDVNSEPDSVEGVAVGRGPGGFTGLRIGIATAAAWARARQVPLVGVGTLEVLACAAATAGPVLALLDAHRGEVAAALYRLDSEGVPAARGREDDGTAGSAKAPEPLCLVPPVVAGPAVVVAAMKHALEGEPAASHPLILAGDGLVRHAGAFRTALSAAGIRMLVERPHAYPRAETAAALARERLLRGMRDDPAELLPIYGRRLAVRPWQESSAPPGSEG